MRAPKVSPVKLDRISVRRQFGGMSKSINASEYRCSGKGNLNLGKCPTGLKKRRYRDRKDLKAKLDKFQDETYGRQEQMHAQDKGDMRLLVSAAILSEMKRLKLAWPVLPKAQQDRLAVIRAALLRPET